MKVKKHMKLKKKVKEKIRNKKIYRLYSVTSVFVQDFFLVFFSMLFRIVPVKKNKIVFSSFNGTQYNGQPKKICDELAKKNSNFDIVWILPERLAVECEFRTVDSKSIKSVFELMTARVWIDNCRKKFWIKKRKKQLYIQTWHGPVCLKGVEKDVKDTLPPFYVRSAIQDSKNADFIVAETRWREENIKQAFWYSGKLIRAEFKDKNLISENEIRNRICNLYNFDLNDKIILYAPTFREDESTKCYLKDFESIRNILNRKTGDNWKVIVRLHPNIANKSHFIDYSDVVVNGTNYSSIEELICISDFIVSDYSGCIFEGFKARKKVILYCQDLNEYVKRDRKLYFDLKDLPAPMAEDIDDLCEKLRKFDYNEYERNRCCFVEKLGYFEEDAAIISSGIIGEFIKKGC